MPYFDLVFTGSRVQSKQRVEGKLFFSGSMRSYRALSGSTSLKPLPRGAYAVSNIRVRDKIEMARDVPPEENHGGGFCFPAWSADLEPRFCTNRTLLRIHPDGNVPGTEGCIGILEGVDRCFDDLHSALASAPSQRLTLLVDHNNPSA